MDLPMRIQNNASQINKAAAAGIPSVLALLGASLVGAIIGGIHGAAGGDPVEDVVEGALFLPFFLLFILLATNSPRIVFGLIFGLIAGICNFFWLIGLEKPSQVHEGATSILGEITPATEGRNMNLPGRAPHGINPTMTTGHAVANLNNFEGRPDRGSPTTWREVWTAPFRVIRAIYRLHDRDAIVRSMGLQTEGQVTGTRIEAIEGECIISTTHYVSYRFEAAGGTHTTENSVGGDYSKSLSEGDPIKVYYLPQRDRLYSAVDRHPRVLCGGQRESLEAGKCPLR